MPKHKQPYSLEQLALKSLKDWVFKFGCQLMEDAHKPMKEEIWKLLTEFLYSGLSRSLANKLTQNLLEIIPKLEIEAESSLYCSLHSELDTEVYMNIVERFIEVSVQPYMLELNLSDCSEFVCEVLCSQLHRLTNLETLHIKAIHSKSRKVAIRQFLERNIGFLKCLKTFKCEKICTDGIIEILAENCRQLQILDVIFSKHVTVESTGAISTLQNLKHLSIWGTFIDKNTCCLLLNILPGLEIFISDQDKVIDNVTEALKLKSLMAMCESPELLVTFCPQLTDITLHFVDCDLSHLVSLPNLRKFSISNCNFDDIEAILKASQLNFLRLSEVRDVNLKIVNSCKNLLTLKLLQCSFQAEISDLDNIHFQTLQNLTIWEFYSTILETLLPAYVNLKSVDLRNIPILNDNIILSLVSKNKNTLIDVNLKSCGYLNVDTLKFVVDNCDGLNKLVYKNQHSDFNQLSDLHILKVYIDQNNFDVELIVDDPW